VLAWIRIDRPARNTRSTRRPARCGNRTLRTSRSHDEYDHKSHDPGTTGHAATSRITESVPEPGLTRRRHSGAQDNRSVQSLATLSLASTPHRTAAIRALSADQAQSLRVIRFQSGLLRDRRVLLGSGDHKSVYAHRSSAIPRIPGLGAC
jgi:hypothetical protein